MMSLKRILQETTFKSSIVDIEWDDTTIYFDGKLKGEMECFDSDMCIIYFIESVEKGKGYAKAFLKELKDYFDTIIASGVNDDSLPFWEHMHSLGLVDEVNDDGGNQIL